MILTKGNHLDFIAQVIDILEDFCEENGIYLPNTERETELNDTIYANECYAIIYGDDYYFIENEILNHINQYLEKGEKVNTKDLVESTVMAFIEILKKGIHLTKEKNFKVFKSYVVTDENIKFFQKEIMEVLDFWNLSA